MRTQPKKPRRIKGMIATHRITTVGWVCAAFMMMIVGGCTGDGGMTETSLKRTVSITEFSSANAAVAPPATQQSSTSSVQPVAVSAAVALEVNATANAVAPASSDSSEAAVSAPPGVPGQENVIESVVGQVSGRPIFADEFFEPIGDQLRRLSERMNQDEFIAEARRIIDDRLRQVVVNELFLAEAEASLTPQQQMGLLSFLKDMQEKNVAERGGTIFGAQQKIAAEQEMTLEEYEEAQKNEALIRNLIFERISPRVIVSWRDVQREYELRKAEFNPAAMVTLKRLRLDTPEQQEAIDKVKARFAEGATFDQVVEELTLGEYAGFVSGDGRFGMTGGDLGSVDLSDSIKAALSKIKPETGQTTEAIAGTGSVQWLTVVAIDQPPAKTLFDVQEQLVNDLQARRFAEEQRKYVDSLMEKGIFDELESMMRRLLAVAILRYRQ